MKKKYLLFSAQYPPHLGGIENYTKNLAEALAKRGNSVMVVTNDTEAMGVGPSLEDDVEVIRLPCVPAVSGRFPIPIINPQYRNALRSVRDSGADGVLVNARFYFHSLVGLKMARELGKRPILLDHSSGYVSFYNPIVDVFERKYEDILTILGKRYNPAYFGVSRQSVEWLRHFSIVAEGILANSIDAASYRALSTARDFRTELSLPRDSFVVCFVGRLLEDKGVLRLLEASRSDEVVRRGIVFVLAGSGPMEEYLVANQKANFRYVGRLSRGDISALFQQSDLMCLPTTYPEGFPTTFLEAAACGCPLVVTNVGGAKELVPDESFGRILPDVQAETLIKTICTLYESRGELRAMGERCQALVEESFSWDATARSFECACDDIQR